MTEKFKSELLLLLVVSFWGISYYLMDISLSQLGPFTLNAFRFGGAFFVALILSFPRLKNVNRTTIKYSFYIGIALIFVYIGATFGVKYTTLSNAGFLCSLTVVFTPVFGYFFKGTLPEKKLYPVILMCVIGIGLLSLNENFKPALGDILCIMCAAAYAGDLLITETAVGKSEVNAYQLGVFQLGFAGFFNLIIAILIETPKFPTSTTVWSSVIFLSIFCTGLAFILQAVAQKHTSAAHVGVIFTLEPVIAGFVAYFLAGEILSTKAYIGAAVLIFGLLIMEIDVKSMLRKIH